MNKKLILNEWKKFFKNSGISVDLANLYLKYCEKLINKNLPIIFEHEHLSHLLGRTTLYLNSVVFSQESHYRHFNIKKRSGGLREIDVPYPALLEIQYWIYNNILENVKFNYCAHGFARKKSIVTNAKIHLNQTELLKIDLLDFFPSISKDRVIALFKRLGYTTEVSYFLGSLCCLNESLPQGAPTSPVLSNIISIKLDKRLLAFCKKFDLKYTRYADDIAISGSKIPTKLFDYVKTIIEDEGFKVNESKTKFYKNKGRRILTGVSINTDQLKAPKEYKKKLFQELFYIDKFGLSSHIAKKKIRIPYYINSLLGKLNYVLHIEPTNGKALEYRKKLLELEKEIIYHNQK